MNRRSILNLSTITAMGLVLSLSNALAQQKQHVSFKTPAENTKYTQQQAIDVGDVPGHQVRVYEIHRTYPNNAPVINGLKLVESWSRGATTWSSFNSNRSFANDLRFPLLRTS